MLSFRPLNTWSSRYSPASDHTGLLLALDVVVSKCHWGDWEWWTAIFCCLVLLQEIHPSTASDAGKPRVIGWSARLHRGVACAKPAWPSATDEGAQSISSLPTPTILILAILQQLLFMTATQRSAFPQFDCIAPRESVTDANSLGLLGSLFPASRAEPLVRASG